MPVAVSITSYFLFPTKHEHDMQVSDFHVRRANEGCSSCSLFMLRTTPLSETIDLNK